MNISVPKLRFEDGREEEQDSGITLRDIRDAYPKCFLLNGNRAHHLDTFVLQDGITYEVMMSAPKEASTAPTASHLSSSRKRHWDQINTILEEVAKRSKKVNKDSKAFSTVKWADVGDVLSYQNYKQDIKAVPADVLDLLYSQLLKIGVVFGSVSSGKEAKCLQFISPMLCEVCALFEGRVMISVEEDLKGASIHTNGHFEYVLKVDGVRKVCVVQAKKTDMEKGMAHALLGAEIIADLDNVSEVYAIVTNYRQWNFLKNKDGTIFRDVCTLDMEEDVPTKASVGKIAGKIYGLLSGE